MSLAIVTGANRGLGFQVVSELAQLGYDVILTARDAKAGEAATKQLGSPRVRFLELDVADPASISGFAKKLADGLHIDALVNNAGASFDGFNADVARRTLDTNYRGAARLTRALFPKLSARANIVMVSSGMGELSHLRADLRPRFLDPELTEAKIEELGRSFEQAVATGQHTELGFPSNAYSVSKALLNAFTRVMGREIAGSGRRINSVCPGWVRTRMGGNGAPRSLEQGARGIVWAATLGDDGPNGGFFRDQRQIPW